MYNPFFCCLRRRCSFWDESQVKQSVVTTTPRLFNVESKHNDIVALNDYYVFLQARVSSLNNSWIFVFFAQNTIILKLSTTTTFFSKLECLLNCFKSSWIFDFPQITPVNHWIPLLEFIIHHCTGTNESGSRSRSLLKHRPACTADERVRSFVRTVPNVVVCLVEVSQWVGS